MNNIRRGVKIGAVSAAAVALVLGVSAPASAADPVIDGDGIVVIGDAHWQFNEYGLAYGWDAADVYDASGYIYYPGEFYVDDYADCGLTGPPTDGTTTVEPNGDFTVTCPEGDFGTTGLTLALSYRLYAQSDTGYLLRQLVAVTNPTDAPIDVTGVLTSFYYDGYTGTQGTDGFYTSLGADTVAADDTWFISVDATGASVAETDAWALSGSAPAAGIVADNNPSVFYNNDSVFAAGETKYFVTFTNMVIPTAVTEEAAEAAFVASLAQTEEYGSFSGRLVAGLPEGLPVVGWGTTPVTPEPVKPQLADTGSDFASAPALALGALVLAAGGALLVRSRVTKVREHRS